LRILFKEKVLRIKSEEFDLRGLYYAIRGISSMGEYDKAKKKFGKRTASTTKPFPDLNREALAYVLDAVKKKAAGERINTDIIQEEDKVALEKLLNKTNFGELYAFAIERVTPAELGTLENTQGQWIKYDQGTDHMPLVKSLQGHGTGWCTAGEATAEIQLKNGDFYVYYSFDAKGNPTVPRAAIRMENDSIAEVRGIAESQNLDPYIADVVKTKLTEFPDGEKYEKKTSDMKRMTDIYNVCFSLDKKTGEKTYLNPSLTKDDLVFLYEINFSIEGFGYGEDPRIAELRKERNPEEDMLVIFECTKGQIAHVPSEINENTKAYIGQLEPGIFQKLPGHLEHVYTSFPDKRIRRESVEIGGKSAEKLITELEQAGFKISDTARHMMKQKEFKTAKDPEQADLVRLRVGDLMGDQGAPSMNDIYKKADQLGLELCPAEVGPHLRLKLTDQPMLEWFRIAMKKITGRFGIPFVFDLEHNGDGVWLDNGTSGPMREWNSESKLVFRLPAKGGRGTSDS
jgi:hypothetical protein